MIEADSFLDAYMAVFSFPDRLATFSMFWIVEQTEELVFLLNVGHSTFTLYDALYCFGSWRVAQEHPAPASYLMVL